MKKLEGGLRQSSFILPEHRRRVQDDQREQERRGKPEVDEQEWELILRALGESFQEGCCVTIRTFDPFEDREYAGVVQVVDQQLQRIKLETGEDDYEWIWIKEMLRVCT
ncbi:YolD-like family protein [Paenibacillus sp. CN-4]|uniref:YolD-like family protein n=1 Tax=Paenibacillus nanchangensis TaxID=3348343 RepID=UPI00397B3041